MADDSGKPNVGTADNINGSNGNAGGNSDTLKPFIIDPNAVPGNAGGSVGGGGSDGASVGTGRRRGRPPGSTNTGSAKRTAATSENAALAAKEPLKDLILLAHSVLHGMSKIPEFEMQQAEAEHVAQCSVNVLRHYDIGQQSQKVLDWTALIGALGLVYGSRIMAYKVRTAKPTTLPNPLTVVK